MKNVIHCVECFVSKSSDRRVHCGVIKKDGEAMMWRVDPGFKVKQARQRELGCRLENRLAGC